MDQIRFLLRGTFSATVDRASPHCQSSILIVRLMVGHQDFVDLAGSEQAAQTHAVGARLKEGCHINRSLLTLTTVIRELRIFFLSFPYYHSLW
ncbi:hypothetical protein DAI22_08g158250 [Oryza sativa Japonica Group]|nr:hypothetical protein DAI22_08g158250 [Oryza sativa Japonica Group]